MRIPFQEHATTASNISTCARQRESLQPETALAHGRLDLDWKSLAVAEIEQPSPRQRGELMLEAHQSLIEADPANLPKFTDVITFLKQDLDNL